MPQFKDLVISSDPKAQIAVRFDALPIRTIYIDSDSLPSFSTYIEIKDQITDLESKLTDLYSQLQLEAQKAAILKLGE